MSEKTERTLSLAGLFTAFMFLQLTVLGLGNRAGAGLLSPERREMVYYVLQVFVLLGFFAYAALDSLLRSARARRRAASCVFCAFGVGGAVMVLASVESRLYLPVTLAVMPCLGYIGGVTYHRMSRETAAGAAAARAMGLGSALAVALQFLLQLQWGALPVLPPVLLAALIVLGLLLLRPAPAPLPEERPAPASPRYLLSACLIAAAFILFSSFYNGYIHHLQILSGYTEYNVYSWPRLMLIPCYLLFAALGDVRQGRLVPPVSLCIALAAMLNSVLVGSAGAYRLNMCLFYCSVGASVAYYDLTFWRLAGGTKHPALWASAGRMLDSALVLVSGAIHISRLPAAAVLASDLAGLVLIILLMALRGDFNLSLPAPGKESPLPPLPPPPAPQCSPESALRCLRERYALTQRETEVLRELVLTEDKQSVIGERLDIRPRTVQAHVTVLYRKTGASTRSGLTDLYRKTLAGE